MYGALVVPVVMYNSSCSALTQAEEKKLDAMHRNHLRAIIGIRWPRRITNERLYNQCKVAATLSPRVRVFRWRMFGHVLRMDSESPAQLSMDFAFGDYVKNMKARRGRHSTNLLSAIIHDAKARGIVLKTRRDLDNLREMASDRDRWKSLEHASVN